MKKTYRIADLTVNMDTFGRTATLAQPYLCPPCSHADITLAPDYSSISAEYPDIPAELWEYKFTCQDFYRALLDFDGMMLHASAIAMDGKAYLFSADSGTGKSTHTALWQQVFGPDRVQYINDDKPALRRIGGCWYAYGTPWCGKNGIHQNICVPLAGICFLSRGTENRIEPISQNNSSLVFRLLRQTPRNVSPQQKLRLLELADCLLREVPLWQMDCNMKPDAACTAYQAMSNDFSLKP